MKTRNKNVIDEDNWLTINLGLLDGILNLLDEGRMDKMDLYDNDNKAVSREEVSNLIAYLNK